MKRKEGKEKAEENDTINAIQNDQNTTNTANSIERAMGESFLCGATTFPVYLGGTQRQRGVWETEKREGADYSPTKLMD